MWLDHPPSKEEAPSQDKKSYIMFLQPEILPAPAQCPEDTEEKTSPVKVKVVPSYLRLFQEHSVALDSEAQSAESLLL